MFVFLERENFFSGFWRQEVSQLYGCVIIIQFEGICLLNTAKTIFQDYTVKCPLFSKQISTQIVLVEHTIFIKHSKSIKKQ